MVSYLPDGLFVDETRAHGKGLFSRESLPKGHRVGTAAATALTPMSPLFYINHSCDPNVVWAVQKDRIIFVTNQAVPAGEELTADYKNPNPTSICRCGAKACRGRF
jgi:SET domain-containing protein